MITGIVWVGLNAIVFGLAIVGFAGLVLAWLIATPIRRPAELAVAAIADDMVKAGSES